MKNPCNNDLAISTRSATTLAAFKEIIFAAYPPIVLLESGDYMLYLAFLTDGPFPLERFHELTSRLNDPTLNIHAVCRGATQQLPIRYEYTQKVWIWQEDGGRTTHAVPDDSPSCALPA